MSNAFEYGDALLPRPEGADEDAPTPQIETNQPYLSLATFRMVVLADEVLESFFETDLSASFRLEPVPLMELPPSNSGFLGGLWSNIVATDNNVKLFHKFSDEVGKTIGRHQVIHRPSIGRYTSIEETRPRESLLTSAIRPSSSGTTPAVSLQAAEKTDATTTEPKPLPLLPDPTSPGGVDPLAQATIAAHALMERTPFAIDGPGDDDDDDDDDEDEDEEDGEAYDDDVLDEVRSPSPFFFFLAATRADRSLARFVCFCRWTLSSRRMTRASRMQIGRSPTVGDTYSFTAMLVAYRSLLFLDLRVAEPL